MRLWHYKLIAYLPNKQLVSQWRECIAIKRQWEKGTLKHPLVSYVMKYSKEYFMEYVYLVREELQNKNIKYNNKYYDEILSFCEEDIDYDEIIDYEDDNCLMFQEHNTRYLKQCYYNLQEKYDRGIITNDEWKLIHKNIYGEIVRSNEM